MLKDDQILKPRLRLCPFCGASGAPELRRIGAVAFVRCNHCIAEGPYFPLEDFLPDDFNDLTDDSKSAAFDEAAEMAKHRAAIAWNWRPWEGAYFPEELEDLEKYAKTDSAALYGKSVSEEVISDGVVC